MKKLPKFIYDEDKALEVQFSLYSLALQPAKYTHKKKKIDWLEKDYVLNFLSFSSCDFCSKKKYYFLTLNVILFRLIDMIWMRATASLCHYFSLLLCLNSWKWKPSISFVISCKNLKPHKLLFPGVALSYWHNHTLHAEIFIVLWIDILLCHNDHMKITEMPTFRYDTG